MFKGKSKRKKVKKIVPVNKASSVQTDEPRIFGSSLKRFFLWLGGIASIAGVAGLFFTYLWVTEPDIRYLPNADPITTYNQGISRKEYDCFYYLSVKQPFKNMSPKGGYVNDIKFVNMSLDVVPSSELIDVDRFRLGWAEQQEIDVKFSLNFNADDCRKLVERGNNFRFAVRYLDNTSNQILYDTQKNRSGRTYDISFSQHKAAVAAVKN